MSGLDRIRVPESKRWIASVIIGVATVMGLFLSASWWMAGGLSRVVIAALVSAAVGWVVAFAFLRDRRRR
ncbi:hypothetical protein [Palleronia pelagia]|uniref:Uncharacterized protein n=1 Tax=Palleronia pelagia TaxID=387096 RepID=A0A1H8BMC1_9RHOB|nr:hypothetical protein [Palleronia pelagia]SEM83912.1 hypothetical protein SAMN04488011_101653 [Palleronia pelagia]